MFHTERTQKFISNKPCWCEDKVFFIFMRFGDFFSQRECQRCIAGLDEIKIGLVYQPDVIIPALSEIPFILQHIILI